MKFDRKLVERLAQLSRIRCSDEEIDALLGDLQKILNYVESLSAIDTDNVEPCNQVIAGHANVFREDSIGATLDRKTFLDNSPDHVGGMIRVPPVIRSNSPQSK